MTRHDSTIFHFVNPIARFRDDAAEICRYQRNGVEERAPL